MSVQLVRTIDAFKMILLVLLVYLPVFCKGASWDNYSSLYNDLFSNYNVNLRPVLDDSTTMNLSVSLVISSLDSISEKEQTMTTNGWVNLGWTDEKLQWDPSAYGDVYELLIQQQRIWLPDIVIKNTVKRNTLMGFKEQPVAIINDGYVYWSPGDIFETSCDLSVTYYPFDIQICKITLYMWLSLDTEVRLVSSRNDMSMEYFSENGQWELISTSADLDREASIPEITFTLKLKRRQLYYLVNIIIPVLFLSCLGPLVFALPADCGEKIGFCVTVLLAYTVFLTIIGDSMPQTSTQTSILSVYLSAMMAISAMSVLLTAFILSIYHRPDDKVPPKPVQSLFRGLRKLLCLGYNRNAVSSVRPMTNLLDGGFDKSRATTFGSLTELLEEITWKMIAECLDRLFLCLFSFITVVISIICLLILATG